MEHLVKLVDIGHAVNGESSVVDFRNLFLFVVIFILNIADYRFEHVFERHYSRRAAELVNDYRHLRVLVGHLLEQIAAGHRFGDENGLADNIAQSHILRQVGADILEQIFDIRYADYVVGVVVIDGDSRIAVVHRERDYFAQRIAYLSRRHIGAVGHYISGVEVIELEDVVYHLFLRVLYNALFSADIDHHAYLLFGHGLLRCVRIVAQQTDETVGRQGEYFYERLGYFLEAEQYSDDLERDLFGHLHGYSLGRKLAQDKREIRGYERNDNDGEAVDNACGDSAQDRYFPDSSGEHINECLRCGCGGQEACEGNADLNG